MNLSRLILLPALTCVLTAGEVREEILVVVNNHIITRRTFQQSVEQETAALYRQFSGKELDGKLREARERVLQGLIDAFLIEDKAVDSNATVSMEDVRAEVEAIKKEYNFASDADFEKALRSQMNIGLDEYMKRKRVEYMRGRVLRSEVYSKVAVEDQELRAYYVDHRDEYKQPSRFRVRELVLAKGSTEAEIAASKDTLAKIQADLQAGKSFEELAKAHSTSPSKATGGDLGWMGKGLLRASIEQAALALKPGQISKPIETDKDLLLVQLIASEEDVVKPFEEVKPSILQKLQEPKAENAKEQFLSGLRVRGNIRYLVERDKILKG